MTSFPPRKRLTIGVILDNVAGESRSSLWPGIADTIQAQDGNLLCFSGGYLRDPHDYSTRGNRVYDLIDKSRLDGLIVWTSSLSSYVGQDSIRSFCDRYRPLPIVSIGMVLDGIPSVVLDSYQGMREVLVHLITIHNRRRMVFVRGPEGHRDAEERFRAYVDVLKEYGLPYEPDLVSPAYKWYDLGGQDMMRRVLDLHPTSFDAVVCAHDNAAVECLDIFQARGLRVPEDIAVTGFNNTPLCRIVTPPLTTVPWRMYERGRQAATLMLSMLAGEPVPDQVLLPTHMVVRQSCGCLDPSVARAKVVLSPNDQARVAAQGQALPRGIEASHRNRCQAAIEQVIEEKGESSEWIAQFVDAFFQELECRTSGILPPVLDRILRQVAAMGGDISGWQTAVSTLRREMFPLWANDPELLARAEDLWHQARVMIGERARRAVAYREWAARQQTERLRKISHVLATTTSIPDLMNVLAEELPHLDISSCYLALYESPAQSTEWCRLVLAYDEKGRIELGANGRRILARQLAMGCEFPPGKLYRMLVAPLHFQDEQLGFVLFAQQSIGDIYEVLRDEISTTLKGVLLAEQNVRLYRQALESEKAAQEGRKIAEEADRLKSRFLSMVSHELLTPLVLLVGLSEMMLREGSQNRPLLGEPYRSDLERIHLSAQHLGNLVRDVLDLTRSQMGLLKLSKKPLDLLETIKAVALVGEEMARGKGLEWHVIVPDCLPMVLGDASRLHQVVLNLVTNAVKFTTHGSVRLQVEVHDEMVTVLVGDTGPGVPQDEQQAIFDEFRQSERTVARGYGGLGIGLAICRQLVELHGGQIGVRSSGEEEGGSTFYFTLPALQDQTVKSVPVSSSQIVLMLTEHAGGDRRLQEHLTSQGFQVQSLSIDETRDWFAQVVALSPGAVVLDCQPASERGWQLIETLKDHPNTQDIPVLFYSLQPADTGAMLALDYMSKPMGATALAQTLQRYGLAKGKGDQDRMILIVDDDPTAREMHKRIVQTALPGCRVAEAVNGAQALEFMRQEQPALVLLDLMMPELDGMGVLAAMQESDRLRGIPVIILTAQMLTQKEMAQLNRGVAAILEKGLFTAEETLAHIERTLARNRRLGSETQRMVCQAMALMHEHYAEPISREEIASRVGVSARHLTRCFHQEVGLSPITYLNRYRVKQAKRLLESGDKNISEIATAVGFSSGSHFTDAFRREMGISPRDYQRGYGIR
jgi:signal transduction histidine kinase/DNA-binding LacI/PurR family transcriptional regulator/AraC-like DNA-binding protein